MAAQSVRNLSLDISLNFADKERTFTMLCIFQTVMHIIVSSPPGFNIFRYHPIAFMQAARAT